MPSDITSLSALNTLGAAHMNNVKAWIDDLVDAWPYQAVCWHQAAAVVSGNALANTIRNTMPFNFYTRQDSAANGDSFQQYVVLAPGTYSFSVLGMEGPNNGIIDWTLDGGAIESDQDWYNASVTDDVLKTTTGITVTDGGLLELAGTVDGKHASSSDYQIRLVMYWLIRTGA